MELGDSSLWAQQDASQSRLGLSLGLLNGMNLEKGKKFYLFLRDFIAEMVLRLVVFPTGLRDLDDPDLLS